MIRFLNIIVVCMLVASAIGVYSIKYESTLQAEKVARLKRSIDDERVKIATLRAEWAYLTQPSRLAVLAARHLGLVPMKVQQIVRLSDLPDRPPATDLIAEKLQGLGLTGDPTVTGTTPGAAQ